MRVLFLSSWYPFPPDNGYKIRVNGLVRGLGAHHDVTLLSFVRPGDRPDSRVPSFLRAIHTVPWQPFRPHSWRSRLAFFSPQPRSLVDTYSRQMADWVRRVEEEQSFDVLIASTIDTARYALASRTPVRILEEHNLNTQMMYEAYLAQRNRVRRWRHWLTYWKMRHYETWLFRQFDGCTFVSDADAQRARHLTRDQVRMAVIPNCVDTEYYAQVPCNPIPDTLVYNGSLTYSANLEAIQYFLAEIWQSIRARRPKAQLTITGSLKGVALNRLSLDNSVAFSGYVDDIRPLVGSAWVCIVPLRSGGGTRFKILEAMALGVPVVSTRKGAEGIKVTHGKDILLADTPTEFAAYVVQVLESRALRDELAGNARALVRSCYDAQYAGDQFEQFVSATVQQRAYFPGRQR